MPSENGVWKHTKLRSSKYLNNLIEQDHRGIKSRTSPMVGFKRFDYAAITIAGIDYYVVSTKANSPSEPYASKTRQPPLSERCTRCIDQSLSRTSSCPTKII